MTTNVNTVENIERLLAAPEKWVMSESGYTITHESGMVLWLANGIRHLHIHSPFNWDFSDAEQDALWPKVEECVEKCNAGTEYRKGWLRSVFDKYLK